MFFCLKFECIVCEYCGLNIECVGWCDECVCCGVVCLVCLGCIVVLNV